MGTFVNESAPVEDTICFSSMGMFGISIEDDPVAIIKFFADAVISCFPFLIKTVLESTNDAEPGI